MADDMKIQRLKTAWSNMKARCFNPNSTRYKNWGGRGIKPCKKWLIFDNFYNDMADGYREGLTLDRIDNEKGYCKKNCRWITRKEQNRNSRSCRPKTFNGKSLTFGQWAELLGCKRSALAQRYYCYKWSLSKTLTHNF